MVSFLHRIGRSLAILLLVSCLCQCTTREVKSTRSSFSFAGDGDENKIRKKFAESGYSIGEDGTIQADKPDLFAGEKPYGMDGDFKTKNARFKKSKSATKEFTTPEYIQRQEFRGVKETRDLQLAARETGSESRQAGRLFKSRSQRAGDYGSYQTSALEGSTRSYRTGDDRVLTQAYNNSIVAEGVKQQAGYKSNAALSMTDVKKMLSPGQYARAMGIE